MIAMGAGRSAAVSLLVVAVLGLGGCGEERAGEEPAASPTTGSTSAGSEGEDAEDASSSEQAPADAPECREIWQDGRTIPRFYQGCVEGAGNYVERDSLGCSSGQRMVRYADQFYGVLGGTVHETPGPLRRDRDYRQAVASCRA